MSYFKSFNLIQHTPLLHFQYDQTGATIRATEVKPKLDKFIIFHMKTANHDIPLYWYVGFLHEHEKKTKQNKNSFPTHPALDYQLKFLPLSKPRSEEFVIIGNPKDREAERSFGLSWERGIEMTIICLDNGLMDTIESHLKAFFVLHNFGKRGSKGFGSFTIEGTTINEVENALKGAKVAAYKGGKVGKPFTQKDYKQISEINRDLKSGFNHKEYRKAKIFEYAAKEKQLRWDKRWIKRKIYQQNTFRENLLYTKHPPIDNNLQNDWKDHSDEEYRFFRAMLGLPEILEYQIADAQNNNKYQVSIEHNGEEQDKIERFRSPMTFKIVLGQVYLIVEVIPESMFKASFNMILDTKQNKNSRNPRKAHNLGSIQTPTKDEFSLEEFLDKYITQPPFKYKKL